MVIVCRRGRQRLPERHRNSAVHQSHHVILRYLALAMYMDIHSTWHHNGFHEANGGVKPYVSTGLASAELNLDFSDSIAHRGKSDVGGRVKQAFPARRSFCATMTQRRRCCKRIYPLRQGPEVGPTSGQTRSPLTRAPPLRSNFTSLLSRRLDVCCNSQTEVGEVVQSTRCQQRHE